MMRGLSKYYLFLSATAVIWGAQPVLVKEAVKELTPATVAGFRYFLLSGTLFLIMRYKGEARFFPPRECVGPLLVMGLFGITVNNVAQFTGLAYSSVTNATLISSTTPAVTAFLAALFLRERLLPAQWLGIFVSLGGTLYLVGRGSLAAILHVSFNAGDVLFFASQVAWAIYSLVSLRVMRRMSVLATTAWAGLFGAVLTTLYGILAGQFYYAPVSAGGALSLVYIIWIGGVLAMMGWNVGVKRTGASQAAIFLNIMPLVGAFCGAFFLGEQIGAQEFFGGAAILSGVYLTTHSRQVMHWLCRRGSSA